MMLLIFGFAAIPVLDDSGGIKVDDDNNCAEPNKEANSLNSSSGAYIWLNVPGGVLPGGLFAEVLPPGNSKVGSCNSFSPTFTQCPFPDDNYWWAPFTTCGGTGVFNLILYSGSDIISKDSWRQ